MCSWQREVSRRNSRPSSSHQQNRFASRHSSANQSYRIRLILCTYMHFFPVRSCYSHFLHLHGSFLLTGFSAKSKNCFSGQPFMWSASNFAKQCWEVDVLSCVWVKHGVVTSFSPSCCLDHQMATFERARVDVFLQNQRNSEDCLFSLNQSLSPNPPVIIIIIIYITVETGRW